MKMAITLFGGLLPALWFAYRLGGWLALFCMLSLCNVIWWSAKP